METGLAGDKKECRGAASKELLLHCPSMESLLELKMLKKQNSRCDQKRVKTATVLSRRVSKGLA